MKPPTKPPTIPSTMSMMRPDPDLLTILLATKPAKPDTTIHTKKWIISRAPITPRVRSRPNPASAGDVELSTGARRLESGEPRRSVVGRSGQGEARIAGLGDLVAAVAVDVQSAGVGHVDPHFPGHVGPEIPGGAALVHAHAALRERGDVRHPVLLRLRLGLYGPPARFAQVVQAVDDPLAMLLDRGDHVGQHRRAAGPGDGEEVGKASHHQSEICAGALSEPGLAHQRAVATSDVDPVQRAGHGVEPGGVDDDVEREEPLLGLDALG